jgi:hypothetical protein
MAGRRNHFNDIIEPNMDEILRMVGEGQAVSQICMQLGISVSTWGKYQRGNAAFAAAIKKARVKIATEIKNAMIQRAKGFQYTEVKKIYTRDENGKMQLDRIEETTKTVPGDVAAQHLLLKNYVEEWHDDPQAFELKRREQERKERHSEAVDW